MAIAAMDAAQAHRTAEAEPGARGPTDGRTTETTETTTETTLPTRTNNANNNTKYQ